MEPAPDSELSKAAARRSALAGLPAYRLFAFLMLGQVTAAMLLQLASLPLGLALSEVFLFALPAVLLARAANYRPASLLSLGAPVSLPLVGLGLFAGASNFLVAGGLQILFRSLVPEEIARQYDAAHLFQGVGGVELALVVAALGLFAPLCEEVAFRGFLQPVLRARSGDVWGVLSAAVLFAVLHLDPIGMAARIELGVLFGVLALWTRSLWPAVAAHAANNLIAAVLLVVSLSGGERASQRPTAPLEALGLAAAGLAGVALALWGVRRLSTKLPERLPEPADPAGDHRPALARAGLWLPAWLLTGLACGVTLLALRWTAFQVALADAASPPQLVLKKLPDAAARKQVEKRLLEEKRKAQSGATDLKSYGELRKRFAGLAKAEAGLSVEDVERVLASPPPAPPAEPEESPALPDASR